MAEGQLQPSYSQAHLELCVRLGDASLLRDDTGDEAAGGHIKGWVPHLQVEGGSGWWG